MTEVFGIDALWVLLCAALVYIMQAGFMCLEAGMTREKNNINVAIKNLCDFGISVAVFWAFGFAISVRHLRGRLLRDGPLFRGLLPRGGDRRRRCLFHISGHVLRNGSLHHLRCGRRTSQVQRVYAHCSHHRWGHLPDLDTGAGAESSRDNSPAGWDKWGLSTSRGAPSYTVLAAGSHSRVFSLSARGQVGSPKKEPLDGSTPTIFHSRSLEPCCSGLDGLGSTAGASCNSTRWYRSFWATPLSRARQALSLRSDWGSPSPERLMYFCHQRNIGWVGRHYRQLPCSDTHRSSSHRCHWGLCS